jgi:hypothetical protein
MAAQRYSFDVESRHGTRWIIDCIETQEQQARNRATALLADPKCAGARIIRSWTRPDGVDVDTEIFCQTRDIQDDTTLRITRIDSIGRPCLTLEDYSGFESRQAMARLFRDYLAHAQLTPTEILHDLRHLKRITEKDGLVREAVDLVARLQTSQGEQDAKTRRAEIHTAIDAMIERARAIDPATLPILDRPFSDVMRSLEPATSTETRRFLMLAALSRILGNHPSWLGKLELLCGMAEAESEPNSEPGALHLLDGVIADILATDVIEEILGPQPNLGATIRAVFDLADGIMPTTRAGAGPIAESLCRLLAAGKLPASRCCISARAHRALRLPQPLKPNDPEQEPAELRKIIARVVSPSGLHSGPETAQALTIRAARTVEQGGKPGRRAAIRAVFLAMPDTARGVLYLCDAARSDLAGDHLPDMEALFEQVLKATSIDEFCAPDLGINQRMACATAAFHAMRASPFSSDTKARITTHIDFLLENMVIGQKLIEKLDRPNSHLRDRALRLVRFCDSGLLPDGKALAKARARVLALLKQPDFPARFVAGIDEPVAAQAALRDFFALLKRSGVT